MTREEFMRENEAAHRRLEALLAGADDARLTAPGPDAGWSAKDHLDHLADWQQYAADLLAGAATPRNVEGDADLDRLNDEIAAATRVRSLSEVRQRLQSSHEALRAQIERLGDADLAAPPPYAPDWDRKLWEHVAGNGFDHYREHLEALEPLLR